MIRATVKIFIKENCEIQKIKTRIKKKIIKKRSAKIKNKTI